MPHPLSLLWWELPIPPKIQIFMWLLHSNRILTKDNLITKGWVGDATCLFCAQDEIVDHLFLTCQLTQTIWFWMGHSQEHFSRWTSCDHIVHFVVTLPQPQQTSFLLVYSALCWTLWKYINVLIFNHVHSKSARNLILLIISLVTYWTGNTAKKVKDATAIWLPQYLDEIPLCSIPPGEALPVESYPPAEEQDQA